MRIRTESKQERIDRLENERIAKANRLREIEMLRGLVAQQELDLHFTKEHIKEMRKQAEQAERNELPRRERRLASAKARLAMMESVQ